MNIKHEFKESYNIKVTNYEMEIYAEILYGNNLAATDLDKEDQDWQKIDAIDLAAEIKRAIGSIDRDTTEELIYGKYVSVSKSEDDYDDDDEDDDIDDACFDDCVEQDPRDRGDGDDYMSMSDVSATSATNTDTLFISHSTKAMRSKTCTPASECSSEAKGEADRYDSGANEAGASAFPGEISEDGYASNIDVIIIEYLRSRLASEGVRNTQKLTDVAILRFLKVRKRNKEKTYKALQRHLEWRKLCRVDETEIDEVAKQHGSHPFGFDGYDKCGRPILTVYTRRHNKNNRDIATLRLFFIHAVENTIKRSPTEQFTLLFDLTGFGLKCMDYEMLKIIFDVLVYNYPDTYKMAIIVNAPLVFTACWSIIRLWLSEEASQIIQFVDETSLPTLVEPRQFPRDVCTLT